MPERFRVVSTIKALYKCSDLPLPLMLCVRCVISESESTEQRMSHQQQQQQHQMFA